MSPKLIKKSDFLFCFAKLFELNGSEGPVPKNHKNRYFQENRSHTLLRKLGYFDDFAKGTRVLLDYVNHVKSNFESIFVRESEF